MNEHLWMVASNPKTGDKPLSVTHWVHKFWYTAQIIEYHVNLEKSVTLNPFTPKSDQSEISPAASPEILHHIVKNLAFHAYLDERFLLLYQFSLSHLYTVSLLGSENLHFERAWWNPESGDGWNNRRPSTSIETYYQFDLRPSSVGC